MRRELQQLIAEARHRLYATPVDQRLIQEKADLEGFRDFLWKRLSLDTRVELFILRVEIVGGKPGAQFEIDRQFFALVKVTNGCDLSVRKGRPAIFIPDDGQFEDHLLAAIGDVVEAKT